MCRFLPLDTSLDRWPILLASTSNRNSPPTWGATATGVPWSLWPVFTLSYILIPKPLTGTIRNPLSISLDWESQMCAPATCKISLTTTSCSRFPGRRNFSRTSPSPIALPTTVPTKSRISRLFFLVNPEYRANVLRSPQMWEVEAQSNYQLSFDGAVFLLVSVAQ